MQFRPERVFSDPRFHGFAHLLYCLFTDFDGFTHQRNFTCAFYLTCFFHHAETIMHLISQCLHLLNSHRGQSVNRNTPITPTVFTNNGVHLNGPLFGPLRNMLTGRHIKKGDRLDGSINSRQTFRQQVFAAILKNHGFAVCRYVHVTRLVMRAPDLHIGRIGRIARVQLIIENDSSKILAYQFFLNPGKTIVTHLIEVARRRGVLHRPMLAHGH